MIKRKNGSVCVACCKRNIKNIFLKRFVKFDNDIRLKKTRYIQQHGNKLFTITIQRGDKLNI